MDRPTADSKRPKQILSAVAYDHSDKPSCLEMEAFQRPVAIWRYPRTFSNEDIKLIVIRRLAST